jgi:hypothetical protein
MKYCYHVPGVCLVTLLLILPVSCAKETDFNNRNESQAEKTDRLMQTVLPELLDFCQQQQRIVLEQGRPLRSGERKIAGEIGIKEIDKIRILVIRDLPKFEGPFLTEWATRHRFNSELTGALTFGYGLAMRKEAAGNLVLFVHELVHVRQMEQMGLENYLRRYLAELETYGYSAAPLEVEAKKTGKKYKH